MKAWIRIPFYIVSLQGHIMRSNGTWYKHSDNRPGRKNTYSFKRYLTPECKNCPIRQKCTTSKVNGRAIDRSEFADVVRCIRIFGAEKLINTLLQRLYVNLSRKYGAFWAFLRNFLFLPVKNFPGPMMQQNSLYELSGYIFNTFIMMGKGYPALWETHVTCKRIQSVANKYKLS